MIHRPNPTERSYDCSIIPGAIVDGTSHMDDPSSVPPPEKTFTKLTDEERDQNYNKITAEWTAQVGSLSVKAFLKPRYPELFS